MLNIDTSKLNTLEREIHKKMIESSVTHPDLKIIQAAEICGCSESKVSKFVKKLGFKNYKQYMDFIYGKKIPLKTESSESDRIRAFLDDFDSTLADRFIEMLNTYDKIILFGYGPSFICVEYFEYRLRIATTKVVIAVQDEISVERLVDDKSLLVIFSATGKFSSFKNICSICSAKSCETLMIVEEYNVSLLSDYENVYFLTKSYQAENLSPYEKSRIIFFIFIEEIIHQITLSNHAKEPEE